MRTFLQCMLITPSNSRLLCFWFRFFARTDWSIINSFYIVLYSFVYFSLLLLPPPLVFGIWCPNQRWCGHILNLERQKEAAILLGMFFCRELALLQQRICVRLSHHVISTSARFGLLLSIIPNLTIVIRHKSSACSGIMLFFALI